MPNDDPKERAPNPGDITFALIDLGVIYGHLARVMRRLADRVSGADSAGDPAGRAEVDFIVTEANGLDERARAIWETKLAPWLVENADGLDAGKPPWPL